MTTSSAMSIQSEKIDSIESRLDSVELLIERYFDGDNPGTSLDDIKRQAEQLYRRAISLYRKEPSLQGRARLLLSIYRMVNDLPLITMPAQRYTRCLTEIEHLVTEWQAAPSAPSGNSEFSADSGISANSGNSGFSADVTAAYIHRNLLNYFQGCDPARESTHPWYRLLTE